MPEIHEYACHVRWSDVDAYGHVNNVKYFEYFQEARLRFIHESGATSDVNAYVVAKVSVDYKRPIFFRREPFVIRSGVTRLGTSSFDVVAQIIDGETMLSRSHAVVVAYDVIAQGSRALAETERATLMRYLQS